jgi:hypothetical protein
MPGQEITNEAQRTLKKTDGREHMCQTRSEVYSRMAIKARGPVRTLTSELVIKTVQLV